MALLLDFDENRENVHLRGPCNLSINFMTNYLDVEPKNEEFKSISASFKWNYVMKKNFLFVFAEHNFQNFCLLFKNGKICKRVFDYLGKSDTDTTDAVDTSFINPIFKAISINPFINSDLIEAIAGWHQLLNEADKEKYSRLMKQFGIYDVIITALPTEHRQQRIVDRSRKRKFVQIEQQKTEESFKNADPRAKFAIPSSHFQLFSIPARQNLIMIIFPSDQKGEFHEYSSVPKNNSEFKCVTCDRLAFIDIDDNGQFYVKLEDGKHTCKLSTQFPSNYQNIKLIQKPGYQIFENCAKYSTKMMAVFEPGDRNQCFIYWLGKANAKFYCSGCRQATNKSLAIVFNEGIPKECVGIVNGNHECTLGKKSTLWRSVPFLLDNFLYFFLRFLCNLHQNNC